MSNKPYRICPDINAPTWDRLTGWRAFLNRWLGIEFQRARFVLFLPGQRLICSPASVPVVMRWLQQRGIPYVVETKLTAVPSEGQQ